MEFPSEHSHNSIDCGLASPRHLPTGSCENGIDSAPRFGMFVLPVMPENSCFHAQAELQAVIEDAEAAEIAGLDHVWVAEHHGTRYGGACPSGLLLLSHLAGRTSRIRLGTAACILPLHEPTRLAEEALLLDQLTRGRLEVGVGRGFLAVDFAALGVDMGERHVRFERGLRVLQYALNDTAEPIKALYPPRFQKKGIPMWGAAATSIESISQFAKLGIGIMLNPYTRTRDEVGRAIALYRETLSAAHPTVQPRILIHEHVYAAETTDRARSEPRRFLMTYLAALKEASSESCGEQQTQHSTGPDNYDDMYPERVAFGTPDTLRARIADWNASGVTDFAFSWRFGGLPSDIVRRSLDLFSTEVIPHFRRGREQVKRVDDSPACAGSNLIPAGNH